MASILIGHDEMLSAWAAKRIPHVGEAGFGACKAVGVATGFDAADKLLAVVVFHDYHPEYSHCQISVAGADPRWVSKATLRALLSIPFEQYGLWKTFVSMRHKDERTIRFAKAVGFTQEAILKDHYGRGIHAVVCRLLKPDYERIYWKPKQAKAA